LGSPAFVIRGAELGGCGEGCRSRLRLLGTDRPAVNRAVELGARLAWTATRFLTMGPVMRLLFRLR